MTDKPHYPYPDRSVSQAREQTEKAIEEFFKGFEHWCNVQEQAAKDGFKMLCHKIDQYPHFRWQIVSPAGIGKTTMVAECLSQLQGKSVLYLVPDKKLAREVCETLKALGLEAHLVEGRSEENCDRHSLVRKLGKIGGIEKAACRDGDRICPFFESCEYQRKKAEITDLPAMDDAAPARVFVGSHEYLTVHRFTGQPDLVIVDEAHWKSFIEVIDLTKPELLAAGDKTLENHLAFYSAISKFFQAIRQNPDNFIKMLASNSSLDIPAAINHVREIIAQHTQMGSSPDKPDSHIEKAVQSWKLPQLLKIVKFLEQLQFDLQREEKFSNAITSHQPGTIRVHALKQNLIDGKTPALLIDGSANLEINRLIWGQRLKHVEIRAERNARIYQVRGKTFSKSSLGYPASDAEKKRKEQLALQNEVIEFTNALAEQTSVFLAAPKKILAILQPLLCGSILAGNYAALRGQNKYEHCKAAVILSREQPRIEEIERQARALQCRREHRIKPAANYIEKMRHIRLKNGQTELVPVPIHPDPFCQAVLEQLREREVEQALDRLRLMNEGEPKEVWILNGLVLDVTVAGTFRWAEIKRHLPIEAALESFAAIALAFPLSGTAWVKLLPDQWSTRDQVNSYVARRGGIKCVETLIRSYKENDTFILADYRTRGQRGKPARALICATEKDPRTALEMIVGPVQDFRIIEKLPPLKEGY